MVHQISVLSLFALLVVQLAFSLPVEKKLSDVLTLDSKDATTSQPKLEDATENIDLMEKGVSARKLDANEEEANSLKGSDDNKSSPEIKDEKKESPVDPENAPTTVAALVSETSSSSSSLSPSSSSSSMSSSSPTSEATTRGMSTSEKLNKVFRKDPILKEGYPKSFMGPDGIEYKLPLSEDEHKYLSNYGQSRHAKAPLSYLDHTHGETKNVALVYFYTHFGNFLIYTNVPEKKEIVSTP